MVTVARWPTLTEGMSVSSTSITASTTLMSAMVISTVPALFIVPMTATSPSSTGSAVTMPAIGARMVVFGQRVARGGEVLARLADALLERRRRSRARSRGALRAIEVGARDDLLFVSSSARAGSPAPRRRPSLARRRGRRRRACNDGVGACARWRRAASDRSAGGSRPS